MRCPPRLAAVCLTLGTAGLASAASANPSDLFAEDGVNGVGNAPLSAHAAGPAALKAQVLLDRAGFSVGVIDAHAGGLMGKAVTAFQGARGLKTTGVIDRATWAELNKDTKPALVTLVVSADDAAGPFIAEIPAEMADKVKLPALSYSSVTEALAEKFHTTPAFLAALNPGKTDLTPGTPILVPNVRGLDKSAEANTSPGQASPAPADKEAAWQRTLSELSVAADQPKAAKVVVDKSDKTVSAYDKDGKLLAAFPATIGSEHDPLPLGNWTVKGVSKNPSFHYNPALFWDADASDVKGRIPAGPNNPVGVVWIELSKEHYGIHGTPEPQSIGRSESHGCIRLTNWDAARLSRMVSPGTAAVLQP